MKSLFGGLIVLLLAAGPAAAEGTPSGGSNAPSKTTAKSARDWYDQGWADSQAGHYEVALKSFQQAVALKSNYAEAYNMLGFCQRKLGNLDQAFANYDRALKLKPDFPEAREYYGEAWLQRGNPAKAEEQFALLNRAGRPEAQELREKIDAYKASH